MATALAKEVFVVNSPSGVLAALLKLIYRAVGIISDILFHTVYRNKTEKLPAIRDSVLLLSANELARLIRRRKLSSEYVMCCYINRIQEVNPILNCVTELRQEEALREARRADALIRCGEKSEEQLATETPLLGVPFSTKDQIAIRGMRQTVGLWWRREYRATQDADVVKLMRSAGAIPLAHTNVPELCLAWETNNLLYGRSKNPYITSRTCGGSSGREGALLAAAGIPIGIGTDIGGSIRIPCMFNGLFGLKPSSYAVSNHGSYPDVGHARNACLVTGPMCRYANDLVTVFRVISPQNSGMNQGQRLDMKCMRFFYKDDDGGFPLTTPVHADMKSALRRLRKLLEDSHNIEMQPLDTNLLFNQIELWSHQLHCDPSLSSVREEMKEGTGCASPGRELLKSLLLRSKHSVSVILTAAVEQYLTPATTEDHLYACKETRHYLNSVLGESGVLLYPTHPTTAPYHRQWMFKCLDFAYTCVFNALQLPVAQVPLGLNSSGVPVGVQIVAAHGQEHLCLAVAQEIERINGGWIAPCEIRA